MNRVIKDAPIWVLLLALGMFVSLATMGTPPQGSVVSSPESLVLDLPDDCQTVLSASNTQKGIQLGYIDKNGRPSIIQYAGKDYKIVHKIKWEKR